MILKTTVYSSNKEFDADRFVKIVGGELVLDYACDKEGADVYVFSRPGYSTTFFMLEYDGLEEYVLRMDAMASYDDYRFFPYMADSLSSYLNGVPFMIGGKSVFACYDEDWIAASIGEEVAMLKSTLSIAPRYYLSFPFVLRGCISKELLAEVGVGITSSTSRIYGYVQYLLENERIQTPSEDELAEDLAMIDKEFNVEVPQHVSVGEVKSWQTDGSETWESFSAEDVDLLLRLGEEYRCGKQVDGVVLNDIGTLYQEGIGVPRDLEAAADWFRAGIREGDDLYAPVNLGDLLRKHGDTLGASPADAFNAYRQSDDPYAHYRIGQAYEEGWLGYKDPDEAMRWYAKAAEEGHHLALKRLNGER